MVQFDELSPDSWRDRWQDSVEVCYRTGALAYADNRPFRAVTYGALAALMNPRYTFRRAYRQSRQAALRRVHVQG